MPNKLHDAAVSDAAARTPAVETTALAPDVLENEPLSTLTRLSTLRAALSNFAVLSTTVSGGIVATPSSHKPFTTRGGSGATSPFAGSPGDALAIASAS